MKSKLKKCLFIGAIGMFILSFPLHFLYDSIGGTPSWVGFFVPVSESVWEHLKLLFYPGIIAGIYEYFCTGKKYQNFIAAKTIGILLGMAGIVISFYTYSGIIGRDFLIADILTYVVGVIVCEFVTWKILNSGKFSSIQNKKTSIITLLITAILFAIYTYNPPAINIFISPV
ncbi:MAG: hypothetical protein E7415_02710 [Ruminococcaceae bacterium]|nr:hypothetical protein [Oscillospiraceae bacterium]